MMSLKSLPKKIKPEIPFPEPEPDNESTNSSKYQFGLTTALTVIVLTAALITLVAYGLYWNNSNRKYDISRPGSGEKSRVLDINDPDEADLNSAVDDNSVKNKQDFLKKELEALDSIGGFSSEALSDQNIRLISPEQPGL